MENIANAMMEISAADLTSGATYSINITDEWSNLVLQSKPNGYKGGIWKVWSHQG